MELPVLAGTENTNRSDNAERAAKVAGAIGAAEAGGAAGGVMIGFEIARTIGKLAVTAGKTFVKGGLFLKRSLDKMMPLEDTPVSEKADFPELSTRVPENIGIKINTLKDTANLLETMGSFKSHSLVDDIINQINDDTYKVLITGRSGTGKSTIINKLLGRDLLKTGDGETTKSLGWLFYADKEERAWYHDKNDDIKEIQLNEIADIPEEPPVYNIFASVKADILEHGAMIVDTPGLNASDEAAEISLSAIERADAVILVVDHYPVAAHDIRLIKKLKEEGKGDSLFIVMNKYDDDEKNPEDLKRLFNERRDVFSEFGIDAKIYPVSCKNLEAADNGFNKFKNALSAYLENDLEKIKNNVINHRIKNASALLRTLCEETVTISKTGDSKNRELIRNEAELKIKNLEKEINEMVQNNSLEINRLKQNALIIWNKVQAELIDEVNSLINKATSEELQSPNKLLADVQEKISTFLLNIFYDAQEQVRDNMKSITNFIQLPIPQAEGKLKVNLPVRLDNKLNIPAEMGSIGMMAYTFITNANGFFSTIACLPNLFLIYALSPFINKVFEQLLKTGAKIGESAFKIQMQKKITEQWPEIDDSVRVKIHEYFRALDENVNRFGKTTLNDLVGIENCKINISNAPLNSDKILKLENCQKELDIF